MKLPHWRVRFEHPAQGMREACYQCTYWLGYRPGFDSCHLVKAPVRRGDWCNRFLRRG